MVLPTSRLSTGSRLSSASATGGYGMTTLSGGLSMRHGHFIDQHGRIQILRGVNLGGSSKLPLGYSHSDPLQRAQFFDGAATVSFVNRPFPLEEADVHFARLQRWGLTFLRFIVTWEAIEHAGPGIYDYEYLRYVRALLEKASEYGLQVYIDPHQDVWSRWTGGDGAPLWTLECIGLEPRHFAATKSALCLETHDTETAAAFPKMIWPTNYFKFACATMFTLFWSGKRYAPSCHVNGVQVQEFLQSHYLNAMTELARTLIGLKNVVGFGTMNEPSSGFIGVEDLSKCFHKGELKYDLAPTPFQGMVLADGIPQVVGSWSNGLKQHVLGRPDKYVRVDPQGVRAWKSGYRCVWQDEGVWKIDHDGRPKLLEPHYFAGVDFGRDFYVPFAVRYADRIRSVLTNAMLFVELPPLEFSSGEFPEISDKIIPRAVNATHWYDGVTLFLRTWRPYFTVDPRTKMPAFGYRAVRKLHQRQLAEIKEYGRVQMNNAPTLIGETGIPFNMNDARAYTTGDYSAQMDALDNTISCLETNLLSYTLWCYTSDNCHQYGDQWNLEDLSIVSEAHVQPQDAPSHNQKQPLEVLKTQGRSDDEDAPSDGDVSARALLAFARPHATKIAGVPSVSHFVLKRRRYDLEYVSDVPKISEHIIEPTEIHVPLCQYPMGYTVSVSGGKYEIHNHDGWDTVLYYHDEKTKTHVVTISTNDPAIERQWKLQQALQHALVVAMIVLLLVTIYLLCV